MPGPYSNTDDLLKEILRLIGDEKEVVKLVPTNFQNNLNIYRGLRELMATVDLKIGSGGGGGTNSNVLIDGGSFTAPNENVLIDGGSI
jgi:hypothetical protein